MDDNVRSGICDVCSGAIPIGHTALCAEVVRQRGERYRVALERISDISLPIQNQLETLAAIFLSDSSNDESWIDGSSLYVHRKLVAALQLAYAMGKQNAGNPTEEMK